MAVGTSQIKVWMDGLFGMLTRIGWWNGENQYRLRKAAELDARGWLAMEKEIGILIEGQANKDMQEIMANRVMYQELYRLWPDRKRDRGIVREARRWERKWILKVLLNEAKIPDKVGRESKVPKGERWCW